MYRINTTLRHSFALMHTNPHMKQWMLLQADLCKHAFSIVNPSALLSYITCSHSLTNLFWKEGRLDSAMTVDVLEALQGTSTFNWLAILACQFTAIHPYQCMMRKAFLLLFMLVFIANKYGKLIFPYPYMCALKQPFLLPVPLKWELLWRGSCSDYNWKLMVS